MLSLCTEQFLLNTHLIKEGLCTPATVDSSLDYVVGYSLFMTLCSLLFKAPKLFQTRESNVSV